MRGFCFPKCYACVACESSPCKLTIGCQTYPRDFMVTKARPHICRLLLLIVSNGYVYRHTLRFGFAFTREGKNELANPSNNSTNGVFNFDGSASGDAMADLLLGKAFSYSETALDPYAHYRWINFEPYVEDQWKVRRNLTLTLGLRYTYYQPEYEQHNFFASFNPATWAASQAPSPKFQVSTDSILLIR